MLSLDESYRLLARKLWVMGYPINDTPDGCVANWLRRKVRHRPGTLFFIVLGVCSAMADIDAQNEGYTDQIDRACAHMRNSDAFRRHQEKQRLLHGIV